MSGHQLHGGWFIWSSLLVALLLTIAPMPSLLMESRPLWVALFFIYWALAIPARISFAAVWLIGVIMDVLIDSLLGQSALSLIFVVYITILFQPRIRPKPLLQQSLIIFFILLIAQLLQVWINSLKGYRTITFLSFFLPIITSSLIWPWLAFTLRSLQLRAGVNSP